MSTLATITPTNPAILASPARFSIKRNVLIHLPNIIFKLVRVPDLPPNQVAFHVPRNLTKIDICNYLTQIYDINPLQVRTMNCVRKYTQGGPSLSTRILPRPKFFKKAIITLSEPFTWPPEPCLNDLFQLNMPYYSGIYFEYKNKLDQAKLKVKEPSLTDADRKAEEEKIKECTSKLNEPYKVQPFKNFIPRPLAFRQKYLDRSLYTAYPEKLRKSEEIDRRLRIKKENEKCNKIN